MTFNRMFGGALVVVGGIFDIIDIWTIYEVAAGKAPSYGLVTGLILAFILVMGTGALIGGAHLFNHV